MDQLSIYVQGNAAFISEILHAVVAMYQSGSTMFFSGLILLLGLLIFTVKYTLDNEKNPHPLREFFLGVVLFMFFVHPSTTPKFDVLVEPIDGTHNVYPVNDVPFLAAVPAWVATGIFVPIIKEYQQHFSNVYSTSSDLAQPGHDPLTAIVHMHSINPTDVAFQKGLLRTFDEFIKRCYVEPSIINNIDVVSPEDLKSMPSHEMLQALEPSANNWFDTTNYMASGGAETQSCSEVHSVLNNALNPGSTNISKMATHFTSLGVNINSMNMLGQVLGDPDAPTPQQLMLGRWLSYKVAEGVEGTQLEHAFGRGIFEAKQQRLYQRAGERSMFLQVMKPMITALEGFVFFLAPIMMLLVVLGGMGIAYIGKYLMILVFTNLWALIAVFVNMLSYESVRDALKTMPGVATNNPAAAPSADMLFSMANELSSVQEIEGQLVVAATMTAAIPSLAIFMLYGGVHSLMGVMGKFGGNYDGKSAAPDLTQTTPDGRTALMNHVVGMGADGRGYAAFNGAQDNTGVEISGGQALGATSSSLRQHAQQEVSSSGADFLTKTSDALQKQSSTGSNTSFAEGGSASQGVNYQGASEAIKAQQTQSGMTGEQATKFFAGASQSTPGFVQKATGFAAGMGTEYQDVVKKASSDISSLSNSEKDQLAEVFNAMDTNQFASTVAESSLVGEGQGWEEAQTAKETYQNAQSSLSSWSAASTQARNNASNIKLNGRDVDLMTDEGALNAINSQMGMTAGKMNGQDQTYADRLRDSGLGHVMDGDRLDPAKLSEYGGLNRVVSDLINDDTVAADEQAANMATAGMLYTELANNTSSSGAGGIAALGSSFTAASNYKGPSSSGALEASGTSVGNNTGVSKAGMADRKADIQDARANEQSKHKAASDQYEAQRALVNQRLAEERQALNKQGVGGVGPYADILSSNVGKDIEPSIADTNKQAARLSEFAAMDGGYSGYQGVRDGMSALLGGAATISNAYRFADDKEHFNELVAADEAWNFLQTDAGREVYQSLDKDSQQRILQGASALYSEDQSRQIDFSNNSTNNQRAQALSNIYSSTTSAGMSTSDRYANYNSADFYASNNNQGSIDLWNRHGANGWNGQSKAELKEFGGQNADVLRQNSGSDYFTMAVDKLERQAEMGDMLKR